MNLPRLKRKQKVLIPEAIFPNFKGPTTLGKLKHIVQNHSSNEDISSKYQCSASEEEKNKRKCKKLLKSFSVRYLGILVVILSGHINNVKLIEHF